MQQLVFFIEPNDKNSTALNLYMNRFIIDEDASHEVVYKRLTQRTKMNKRFVRILHIKLHGQKL